MTAVGRVWAWLAALASAALVEQRPGAGWAARLAWWLAAAGVAVAIGELAARLEARLPGAADEHRPAAAERPAPAPAFRRIAEAVRLALRDARYADRAFAAYLGRLALGEPEGADSVWWRDDGRHERARRALDEAAGGRVPWDARRPPTAEGLKQVIDRVEEAYERSRLGRGVR